MWDEILALSAALRQLRAEIAPLLPPPEPPPLPVLEREMAEREVAAAEAEVTNQEERAAANIKAAQEALARAQAILAAAPVEAA